MKVFITENWEEISGKLSKLGKAILVEKGDIEKGEEKSLLEEIRSQLLQKSI